MMGVSMDEVRDNCEQRAAAYRMAMVKYPDAYHIEGAIWEVHELTEADSVFADENGVWPCKWFYPSEEDRAHGMKRNAVCVRQRCYSLGAPHFLAQLAETNPAVLAAALAHLGFRR